MNKMIEAKESIEGFTDENGLISGNGDTSGNGLRYTSEYLLGLALRGLRDSSDDYNYFPTIDSCQLEHGLFSRSPDKLTDQQGPDDYIAIISMSVWLRQKYHIWIYQYALKNNWIFLNARANEKTLKSAWFGRMQQFVAHLKYANNVIPDMKQRLIWAYCVAIAPKKDDQDSWCLAWHLKRVGGDKGKIERCATKIFEWRLKLAYPKGIGQVIGAYFGNAKHPTAVLLEDIF